MEDVDALLELLPTHVYAQVLSSSQRAGSTERQLTRIVYPYVQTLREARAISQIFIDVTADQQMKCVPDMSMRATESPKLPLLGRRGAVRALKVSHEP